MSREYGEVTKGPGCETPTLARPESVGHINNAIDQVQTKTEIVAALLDKLEHRLQSVSDSCPKDVANEKREEIVTGSEKARRIYGIGNFLDGQIFRLKDIIESLDF